MEISPKNLFNFGKKNLKLLSVFILINLINIILIFWIGSINQTINLNYTQILNRQIYSQSTQNIVNDISTKVSIATPMSFITLNNMTLLEFYANAKNTDLIKRYRNKEISFTDYWTKVSDFYTKIGSSSTESVFKLADNAEKLNKKSNFLSTYNLILTILLIPINTLFSIVINKKWDKFFEKKEIG